jgi:hypothetical protein
MKKPKKETIKTLDKDCRDLWSDCVLTRDRVCRHSGDHTGLSAHHIRSVGHASTRFDLENGMALSWTKIHFLQKTSPERFFDYVIDIIGMDEYLRLKAKSMIPLKRNIADYRDEKARLQKLLKQLQDDYGFRSLPF